MVHDLQHVLEALHDETVAVKANGLSIRIARALPAHEADAESVVWIKPGNPNAAAIIAATPAPLIVCDEPTWTALAEAKTTKVYLLTPEPKRIFSKLVNKLLVRQPAPGIHPTASIHPNAKIGSGCSIGPFTYIGEATVGNNTIIHGHCHIYDQVEIGSACILHAGVVIGSDGFGYARDENNAIEKFPHIGGVKIGNHVEIGANTCIDRGALGNTVIADGVKIDNLVHIAHNVRIHANAFIIANAMIGGSTTVGEAAWVAPSASILQQLNIGDNATVGVGAIVTKDVPPGQTWTGSPAKPLSEFLATQKKIKNLPD
ncbi:UDP-3-O-(3-hydroxymyristoyl)glucosamine N-acyltransferase [Chryseolinea lacunae]|uniref:UDP-3-O-(3-hydroxymyristoyl)glucosamine N-acyltransferase n=1 Tax=Chryseolinea lacunae TaxID=2801331 RepID=A0ABS1KT90_9BACT|nr:UDP-3-O-(3-hydroxymyristoyl)glucosamine N-acyltransferase [Chryseolinea lacunae]MBL0742437.1 UDP-3-O-(3-hydroxymyristoyl)glucosamine N-acyltransferase [Chryseolinea lacunae]